MKQKAQVFYQIDVQEFHLSTLFQNMGTILPKHVLEISGILLMSGFLSPMLEKIFRIKAFSSGIR
jgi:hypothetical protein